MFKNISACLLAFIILFNNLSSSEEDHIYKKPLGKISQLGPHHIYLTETEDSGGQLDNLMGEYDEDGALIVEEWITLKEYAHNLGLTAFNTGFIFSLSNDHNFTNPVFLRVLNDFRNILKATRRSEDMNFEGDIRNDEAYISVGRLPRTFSWDGEINVAHRKLPEGQYAFAWKQDNNGRSYIASPVVLDELEPQCASIRIEKEDEIIDSLTGSLVALEFNERRANDIFSKYVAVSKKFLSKEKRRFIGSEAHISLLDFTRDYLATRQSTIDITNLSARARIYLLTDIIRFKLPFKNKTNRWKMERKTIRNSSSPSRDYEEFVDLIPTTFQIGSYSYKLENAATTQKPGGGRLYGLTSPDIADTYEQIITWLAAREANLKKFKSFLIGRLQGPKVNFTYSDREKKGQEATDINRFLNGLSLLFDFEVARRLVRDDKFQELPVLAALPYLLENFESMDLIRSYFNSFFTSDDREGFLKRVIIKARKDFDTQKKIRESMKAFHISSEDSGDEYD